MSVIEELSPPADPVIEISELPELGAVETSEPAEIKDMLPAGRSETGPVSNRLVTDRWVNEI